MIQRPPRSTRTDPLFPYTTLFRSDRNLPSNSPWRQCPPSVGSPRATPVNRRAVPQRRRADRKDRVQSLACRTSHAIAFGNCKGILIMGEFLSVERSEEHTSELQSLMRISYDVFCLQK